MMKKKPSSRLEGMQQWLNNEMEKDQLNLNNEKEKFIKQIKMIKKEEIIQQKEEIRLTLWQKIKKVLMG
jgi:hypothetical protein